MSDEKTSTTANVTDVRKYEQPIIFGKELPEFPEGYRHPESYYLHLPADTLFSLADSAKKLREGR